MHLQIDRNIDDLTCFFLYCPGALPVCVLLLYDQIFPFIPFTADAHVQLPSSLSLGVTTACAVEVCQQANLFQAFFIMY